MTSFVNMFTSDSKFWKCSCSKLITRVAKPGCSGDDVAVASLPDQWSPRRSGFLLAEYLKKRSLDHAQLIKDLQEDAKALNKSIDDRITFIAENLLAHIEDNQRTIDCIVTECDHEPLPLLLDKKTEALKKIDHLIQERWADISTFRVEALDIEKERADGIKNILRDKFHRFIKVGEKPLHDLLKDFDGRIYDINQQLLSNERTYIELEEQLKAEGKDSVVRSRSLLNQLCLGVPLESRNEVVEIHTKREFTADEIKECIRKLVELYNDGVSKLFVEFSELIINFYKHLANREIVFIQDASSKVNELQGLIKIAVESLNVNNEEVYYHDLIEHTGSDADELQKSLTLLGERLRDTYLLLHDSGHLFDAHMHRVGLAQKLTVTAVEDLITNNDMTQLNNEVPFNMSLEQMRSSSDTLKIQQLYDSIVTMLVGIGDTYAKHRDAELAKLEEYMNLLMSLAALLTSEFEGFLMKHPRIEHAFSSFGGQSLSLNSEDLLPVQQAVFLTDLHCLVLINWRNEYLDFIESNFKSIPEWLRQQARFWVDERAASLHKRYEMKILSHNVRLERVKVAKDNRLAEIHYHDDRLNTHLRAIADLAEKLPMETANHLALDSPKLYPLCMWADDIQRRIDELLSQDPFDPEVKKLKMSSYDCRLTKHRVLFDESVEKEFTEYKVHIASRVNEARKSNADFLSSIRMFSEGGSYSSAEALKTSAALTKGGEAIEACLNKALDAANQRRIQLIALATQRLAPIQRIVEETVKSNVKGKDSKNKPQPVAAVGKKKK